MLTYYPSSTKFNWWSFVGLTHNFLASVIWQNLQTYLFFITVSYVRLPEGHNTIPQASEDLSTVMPEKNGTDTEQITIEQEEAALLQEASISCRVVRSRIRPHKRRKKKSTVIRRIKIKPLPPPPDVNEGIVFTFCASYFAKWKKKLLLKSIVFFNFYFLVLWLQGVWWPHYSYICVPSPVIPMFLKRCLSIPTFSFVLYFCCLSGKDLFHQTIAMRQANLS